MKFTKYTKEVQQQVVELCQAGVCKSEIVTQTGVSYTMVGKWTKGMRSKICHPRYRTHTTHHDYFSPENLELHPERFVLVGFLAADGCIYASKVGQKRLCINLAQKDETVLSVFNSEICESNRKIGHNHKTNSSQWYVPSNQLCEDLARFGIIPRKTFSLTLPKLTDEPMRYFIRGLFYGDGCLVQSKSRTTFHLVGNNHLMQGIRNYLVPTFMKHCVLSKIKRSPRCSQLLFQGKHAEAFADFIFNDSKMMLLPRKHFSY